MTRFFCLLLPLFCLELKASDLRILTDRTASHLTPLMELYEKKTGVQIKMLNLKKGMLARLQRNPRECDIVLTKTAVVLEEAKKRNLLRPYSSNVLKDQLHRDFQDEQNFYFVPSYRARAIYYSKSRVDPSSIKGYMDLCDPKWKGRVAIRSGFHKYNLSLFTQMRVDRGEAWTRKFISGLKQNLVRSPQGNDRAQISLIHKGDADLVIANSYYMGVMMGIPEQRPWAESCGILFPEQSNKGCYLIRSGVGLSKSERNPKDAEAFLEFLISSPAQMYFSLFLNAISVDENIPLSKVNMSLGAAQESVREGRFKKNPISISKAERKRQELIEFLKKIKFDS